MACRFGACEINNNRPKPKKTTPKTSKKKSTKAPPQYSSSSEWSDSDDSHSGCSACCGSSSTSSCFCSECNMETDSSEDGCYMSAACRPRVKKTAKKPGKVLQCKEGVCQWVPRKKIKKAAKPKKSAAKNGKVKKPKPPKNCHDCC